MSTTPSGRPSLVVGLTGGIASGKSLAAHQFALCGAELLDTDALAREVVAPGSEGLQRIYAAFGQGILTADGELDRSAMRRRIFDDPAERERLEAITHPLIEEQVQSRLGATDAAYAVLVVPLLLEKGWHRLVDRVAVVDCPVAAQRRRLRDRDGSETAEIERILASQMARGDRVAAADDVLVNDRSPQALQDQVAELDALYRRLARGDAQ